MHFLTSPLEKEEEEGEIKGKEGKLGGSPLKSVKDPFQDYYFATLPSLFPFGMPLQREREKFQGQNRESEQRHYFSGKKAAGKFGLWPQMLI